MIGTGIFGYSMIAIYTGANSYIIDSFPEFAASALAAKTLMSRLCGAAIPMFVDRLYHSKLGPQWSSCLLAIVATVNSHLFFTGQRERAETYAPPSCR